MSRLCVEAVKAIVPRVRTFRRIGKGKRTLCADFRSEQIGQQTAERLAIARYKIVLAKWF